MPTPSGPPIAQQADVIPSTAPAPNGLAWEVTQSDGATMLRLVNGSRSLLMALGCRRGQRLLVQVPSFTQVGSEDRLTLGFGDEAMALVARPPADGEPGVTAEGAAPPPARIEEAKTVSAVYGSQQLGPVPAPPEKLRQMLADACE